MSRLQSLSIVYRCYTLWSAQTAYNVENEKFTIPSAICERVIKFEVIIFIIFHATGYRYSLHICEKIIKKIIFF